MDKFLLSVSSLWMLAACVGGNYKIVFLTITQFQVVQYKNSSKILSFVLVLTAVPLINILGLLKTRLEDNLARQLWRLIIRVLDRDLLVYFSSKILLPLAIIILMDMSFVHSHRRNLHYNAQVQEHWGVYLTRELWHVCTVRQQHQVCSISLQNSETDLQNFLEQNTLNIY